jgi:hypothetical protein
VWSEYAAIYAVFCRIAGSAGSTAVNAALGVPRYDVLSFCGTMHAHACDLSRGDLMKLSTHRKRSRWKQAAEVPVGCAGSAGDRLTAAAL